MLDLFKKLNPYVFIIALSIGILYSYLVQPSPTVITKYPTDEDSPIYKDNSGMCYRYRIDDTPCPTDISHISKIPIQ
jgi:hypothetical protein